MAEVPAMTDENILPLREACEHGHYDGHQYPADPITHAICYDAESAEGCSALHAMLTCPGGREIRLRLVDCGHANHVGNVCPPRYELVEVP